MRRKRKTTLAIALVISMIVTMIPSVFTNNLLKNKISAASSYEYEVAYIESEGLKETQDKTAIYFLEKIPENNVITTATIQGWIVGEKVGKVTVVINGIEHICERTSRDDVKSTYPEYDTSKAGFLFDMNATQLNNGQNALSIREYTTSGTYNEIYNGTVNVIKLDNTLFDWSWYYFNYHNDVEVMKIGRNPDGLQEHYYTKGIKNGYSPCVGFNPKWYITKNSGIQQDYVSAYVHFIKNCLETNVKKELSPFFNLSYYQQQNSDLKEKTAKELFEHFRIYGYHFEKYSHGNDTNEAKALAKMFVAKEYAAKNDDVKNECGDGETVESAEAIWSQWLAYSLLENEGRVTSKDFDMAFYMKKYEISSAEEAFWRYINSGYANEEKTKDVLFSSEYMYGTWEGSYDGYQSGKSVERKLTMYIDYCDSDGKIEGIAALDDGANGSYFFSGTVDFEIGNLNIKGTDWYKNVSDFEFTEFSAMYNMSTKSFDGNCNDDTSRKFSVSKISEQYKSMRINPATLPLNWEGEYDGHSGNVIVRRNMKLQITNIEENVIEGTISISPSNKENLSYALSGSYYFKGNIDTRRGKIICQGYEWINAPTNMGDFSFLKFNGIINTEQNLIDGESEKGIWQLLAVDDENNVASSTIIPNVTSQPENTATPNKSSTQVPDIKVTVTPVTIVKNTENPVTTAQVGTENPKITEVPVASEFQSTSIPIVSQEPIATEVPANKVTPTSEVTATPIALTDYFKYYGDAQLFENGEIQLTPLSTWASGSVWYEQPNDITNGMKISFDYWAGGGQEDSADGFVLMLSDKPGLGDNGCDLGFVTGEENYGVEFDSYYNSEHDPKEKHIAIVKGDISNHLKYVNTTVVDDEEWHHVEICYLNSSMQVYVDQELMLEFERINLGKTVYIGYSASTGAGLNFHKIKNPTLELTSMEKENISKESSDEENTIDISETSKVELEKETFVYNGKAKRPAIIVMHNSKILTKGKDFTVKYSNNKNIGTASIVVTGIGKYSGMIVKNFIIVPKGTSLSGKVTAKSKGFSVKWKKQNKQISGYYIQYSTSKNFTKKNTVTKKVKASLTKMTISKLKAKKEYYVRICTYKKIGISIYTSYWSSAKSVKTKK